MADSARRVTSGVPPRRLTAITAFTALLFPLLSFKNRYIGGGGGVSKRSHFTYEAGFEMRPFVGLEHISSDGCQNIAANLFVCFDIGNPNFFWTESE